MSQSLTCDIKPDSRWRNREFPRMLVAVSEARYSRARWHIFFRHLGDNGQPMGEDVCLLRKRFLEAYEQVSTEDPREVKCEVAACPRFFRPGVTGSNGRCSRCAMRQRRNQPEVTKAEAEEAEARAAGLLSSRSERVIGYIRPELAQALAQAIRSGRFPSESDAVNQAVAALVGRKELA